MRFRPTKRQRATAFNATQDFYAASSDNPRRHAAPRAAVPAQRRAPQPSGKPLEADVVRACAELLAVHPQVLFAVRQNSGAASYEASTGKFSPVWFYRIVRPHEPMTITDFWGIVRHVVNLFNEYRPFAIECKRPGWKRNLRDDRENRQEAFIALVRNCGGIGGFVTNVDELTVILAG